MDNIVKFLIRFILALIVFVIGIFAFSRYVSTHKLHVIESEEASSSVEDTPNEEISQETNENINIANTDSDISDGNDNKINIFVDGQNLTINVADDWTVVNNYNDTCGVSINENVTAIYADSMINLDDDAAIQLAYNTFKDEHDNANYEVMDKKGCRYIIFSGSDNTDPLRTYIRIYQTAPNLNKYICITAQDLSGTMQPTDLANLFTLSF